MKTTILTFLLALAVCFPAAEAQTARQDSKRRSHEPKRLFRKNQMDGIFSFGVLPTFLMDKGAIHVFPVGVGATYLIGDHFGLDAMIGYSVTETEKKLLRPATDESWATWTNSFVFVGIRPGIHFTKRDNLDIYGGFFAGAYISNIAGKTNGSAAYMNEMAGRLGIKSGVEPAFGGFTGVRYAVSPKWTLCGEIGFGVSLVSVGAGYRLM